MAVAEPNCGEIASPEWQMGTRSGGMTPRGCPTPSRSRFRAGQHFAPAARDSIARQVAAVETGEDLTNLRPRGHPRIAGFAGVMRRREQQRAPLEAEKVSRPVVDEVIGVDHTLVAAEDDVRGGDERKVPTEPVVFG